MGNFPPGSQAAEDEAFAVLEAYLTTRLLPQYAKEISELLATEKGRDFMKGCAANGFGDAETKRAIENLLILQGKVTPERAFGCDWEDIAAVLGHRTTEMVRLYTRQADRAKRAVARMERAEIRSQRSEVRELIGRVD